MKKGDERKRRADSVHERRARYRYFRFLHMEALSTVQVWYSRNLRTVGIFKFTGSTPYSTVAYVVFLVIRFSDQALA